MQTLHSPINDHRVETVLSRLHHEAQQQQLGIVFRNLPQLPSFLLGRGVRWNDQQRDFYQDKYIAVDAHQGSLLYLLARAVRATTIVEFGTSYGISTIYLASAVRDNGGGKVIGTELVPTKVAQARRNLAEAGLAEYVEIREGNALTTLRDLQQSIDLVLVDGFPPYALDVLKLLHPHIRLGGGVLTDDVGTFRTDLRPYVEFLQNPANGYQSTTLNLNGGTEFAIKLRH